MIALLAALVTSHMRKRAGRRRPLIGSYGIVESELAPDGIVLVEGEAFLATAETGSIAAGSRVVVVRMQGSTLTVKDAA